MAVGNLEFIKSASGTNVRSIDVNDCFSADYDVYKIVIHNIKGYQASGDRLLDMRFIDTVPSVITGAEYDYAVLDLDSGAAFAEQRATNTTLIGRLYIYNTSTALGAIVAYIFNPNDSSSYTFATYQSSGNYAGRNYGMKGIGVHKQAEQITGVHFITNADNMDINLSVYGVK